MQLCNLKTIERGDLVNIEVSGEIIKNCGQFIGDSTDVVDDGAMIFDDAIVFPGLINSHDHLDFNVFTKLSNGTYPNYKEWGVDIHGRNNEMIQSVLTIPVELRTQWGLYKNLLNGITTVVNHGKRLQVESDIISVLQNNRSLHSVEFEKRWKLKLNNIFTNYQPVVIHIGEGTDKVSHEEINELIRWNFFRRKIIGVHGVAMDGDQAKAFRALVWCPASNSFLFNAAAPIDELKAATTILFGTDSTLTSGWDLWQQLRAARDTLLLTDQELFDSLTKLPATIWKKNSIGSLSAGKNADLCIARSNGKSRLDAFFSVRPEDLLLVMHRGEIRLFDAGISNKLSANNISLERFSEICLNGRTKYVFGNLAQLVTQISHYYPNASFPFKCAE